MIVCFIGERKSGKDYFADLLTKEYDAVRLSFSDEVRHLTVQTFPWMPFNFEPAIKDNPFDHPRNPNAKTPRDIWLLLGKVRDVDPDYFVHAFEERNKIPLQQMNRIDRLYVITDFRTPQEYAFLKKHKIPIIKIEREDRSGIEPDAFEQYVRDFTDYNAKFTNRMNGTAEFNKFFKNFLGE